MEAEELAEVARDARRGEERRIGMTMAVFAALLAVTTMLGHRAHTEEVLLQTQATDDWGFYQAKNNRGQMYEADAQLAQLYGAAGGEMSTMFAERAQKEKRDAEEVRTRAEEREKETRAVARRASFYDGSEIFLEVGIVLCSIALLADALLFWRLSFVPAAIGVILGAVGLFGA